MRPRLVTSQALPKPGDLHRRQLAVLLEFCIREQVGFAVFIETLLRVASSHEEEPLLLTAASELVEEIRAHRPDWLVAAPDVSSQAEHRKVRAEIWSRMATKPTDRPMNMLRRQQFLYDAIAASNERQRVMRRARQSRIALP